MILYFDTSALLKLYLAESGSVRVRTTMTDGNSVFTHLVTFAEMRAAFAQAVRIKRMSEADHARQLRAFEADWAALEVVAVDEPLVRRAGEYAARFGFRGYDSVHLAAAERTFEAAGRPVAFAFAAFDRNLCAGAESLGMTVLN